MSKIVDLTSFEILDSRGIPTILTKVTLENGISAKSSVPSGASTGKHEAVELRDKDKGRYFGKGVKKNLSIIHSTINDALQGLSVFDQKKIDNLLIQLDGTANKRKLGANTLLSVSMAISSAAAKANFLELFQHIGGINARLLPIPLVNIINGGAHAQNNLDIQEFMIVPIGSSTFQEAIMWCSKVFYNLKDIIISKGYSTGIGDEGGFASQFKNNNEPLELIIKAITKSQLSPEKDVLISLDVASTEFFKKNYYHLSAENIKLSSNGLVSYLKDLTKKYPIFSIEDGCAEDDWNGWSALTKELGDRLLVGDDLFVTNLIRLNKGIKKKCANSILIKPNQIGTLSETLDCINLAKSNAFETIISHRSGETEDTFIADLSVGTNSKFIKTGSINRSERCAKYNRLLYLEKLYKNLEYSGNLLNV